MSTLPGSSCGVCSSRTGVYTRHTVLIGPLAISPQVTNTPTCCCRYEVLEMDPGKRLVLSGLSEHHTQVGCARWCRRTTEGYQAA